MRRKFIAMAILAVMGCKQRRLIHRLSKNVSAEVDEESYGHRVRSRRRQSGSRNSCKKKAGEL